MPSAYLPAAVDELAACPADVQARVHRVLDMIEVHGPQNVGMPHVRPLGDKLWEIRALGRDAIGRAIYVAASGRRVVVLHAFVKKTQKTLARAIALAKKRRERSMVRPVDGKAVKERALRDPEVRREYEALEAEFAIASALIEARTRARMTQSEVATAMGTSQAAVSRMESGAALPSVRTLRRYADATRQPIRLTIVPRSGGPAADGDTRRG